MLSVAMVTALYFVSRFDKGRQSLIKLHSVYVIFLNLTSGREAQVVRNRNT